MKKELSVVMPVHNEAEIIEKVVRDFHDKIIRKVPGSELIVAEDGSTDGTREILKALGRELGFRLISTPEKKGYFRAAKEALKLADGRFVLFTDSDNTHDPDDFWKMYDIINGCDMVLGFRYPRMDSIFRKIVTKIHNSATNVLFSVHFHDINCPFRLIRKEVIDDVADEVRCLRYAFSSEFVIRSAKKGYRIEEVFVRHLYRRTGTTFIRPKKLPSIVWDYFTDIIRLRLDLL